MIVALAAVLTALAAHRCRQASARIDLILTEELGPSAVPTHVGARAEERLAPAPVARKDLARFGQA
ncbi:hypothetical protein BU204_00120 [Actinophytocola xanthii]|uniref:Uncharacterized protein n=2 Tax=Actinophytocola xanthii TaxID=1912961 RepID=A0A1Q8CYE1_9PSEU|nr:hypothetical protein BU204_00120 [Actinophytocola xanthii]